MRRITKTTKAVTLNEIYSPNGVTRIANSNVIVLQSFISIIKIFILKKTNECCFFCFCEITEDLLGIICFVEMNSRKKLA